MPNIYNPYYTYRNILQGSYNNFSVYNHQVIKLANHLNNIKIDAVNKQAINLQLIIGASAEEQISENNIDFIAHHRQLFPIHIDFLYDTIKSDIKTEVIIIAPNDLFDPKYHKEPLFIKKTPLYKWHSPYIGTYISAVYPIRVSIFCCPMPHKDDGKDKKYIQTDDDILFIKYFYKNLSRVFDTIENSGGVIICYSYAVFNNIELDNYEMFSEIKKLFPISCNHKRLLCEWIFSDKCHWVRSFNKYEKYCPILINYSEILSNHYSIIIVPVCKNDFMIKYIKWIP